MPKTTQYLFLALLPLLVTCRPLAQVTRNPAGMSTYVECKKFEGELFVEYRMSPIPEGTPCQVAFEGAAPEKLEVLTQNGYSRVCWKVDQAHLNTFSSNIYHFKLITPSDEYSISIKLQPTSQQIVSATIQSLLRLH